MINYGYSKIFLLGCRNESLSSIADSENQQEEWGKLGFVCFLITKFIPVDFFRCNPKTFVKNLFKVDIIKFCHSILNDIMSLILIGIKIIPQI